MHHSSTATISVLLPYRGCEKTIAHAIQSTLPTSSLDVELIAINDGSTDDAPRVVQSLAQHDARIVSCENTSGQHGIVGALQWGLGRARGKWIARMDADDISLPDRLAAQLAAISRSERMGVVGTQVRGVPDAAVGEGLARYIAWQNQIVDPEAHARELFVESPICHPSMMLRRDALEQIGGWQDTSWAEDYDLLLRLHAHGWQLSKVPQVLLEWTHREGRITFGQPRYALEQFVRARAHYLARILRDIQRDLWVWGAGPTGRRLARALEAYGLRACGFIDIDPRKIGRIARGVSICDAHVLDVSKHFVLAAVGARGARDIVREELVARGFVEGNDFLCAS